MNSQLFKYSLILKLNEFIAANDGTETKDLPVDFNGWFDYFLEYLGYTVEDSE